MHVVYHMLGWPPHGLPHELGYFKLSRMHVHPTSILSCLACMYIPQVSIVP